ncbi:MAG: hypothetical protein ACK42L_02665 [Thermoanaerobaculum sp.]
MQASFERFWWFPAVVGFAAILWVLPFWPSFVSPNEWPRVYQALAVVHRGSLAVNEEVLQWGACEDLSSAEGKLYPNKAPGLLPLLVPAAGLAHVVAHGSGELPLAYLFGRILGSGLPWLFASLLLARELTRRWGEAGTLVAGALVLATPWLPAGALLFSHALAGACLLAGLVQLSQQKSLLFAGLLLGWAAVSEYPTALVGLFWLVIGSWRGRWGVWPAWLGFAIPLAFLAVYNWVCFGSPFVLSSARELYPQFSALSQQGFFGIGWPRLSNFWLLLFSPQRGLLFWAPFLLVGLLPRKERLCLDAWLGALALLVLLSGYPNAHGGWFPGPRYLISVFPLLALGAAGFLAVRWHLPWVRGVALVVFFLGLPAAWLPLFTFPFSPPEFALAPVTFHWPLVQAGTWMPMGVPGSVGLRIMGVLVLVAAGWLMLFQLRTRFLSALALTVSVMVWVSAKSLTPELSFRQKLELAVVHDLYTGTPGQSWLARLQREARSAQEQRLLHHVLQQRPQPGNE